MDFQKTIDGIANELKAIYNGEILATEEDAEMYGVEVGEPLDFYNYFFDDDSIYNIDYVVAGDKETLLGVRVMVACGGPNIYINTWENQVQGYWWGSNAFAWIPSEVSDSITEVFEELWHC